jgi:hypothetical protein
MRVRCPRSRRVNPSVLREMRLGTVGVLCLGPARVIGAKAYIPGGFLMLEHRLLLSPLPPSLTCSDGRLNPCRCVAGIETPFRRGIDRDRARINSRLTRATAIRARPRVSPLCSRVRKLDLVTQEAWRIYAAPPPPGLITATLAPLALLLLLLLGPRPASATNCWQCQQGLGSWYCFAIPNHNAGYDFCQGGVDGCLLGSPCGFTAPSGFLLAAAEPGVLYHGFAQRRPCLTGFGAARGFIRTAAATDNERNGSSVTHRTG